MLPPSSRRNAPGLLGAFALALALASCDKSEKAAPWDGPTVEQESSEAEAAAALTPVQTPAQTQAPSPKPSADGNAAPLRFIAYNVENWLTMDRYVDRKPAGSRPKPEKERKAVTTILARHAPDVVGLCEIGSKDDLKELQGLLKEAGVDLPHAHHTGGSDSVRRLAILSRYPILSTELHTELDYQLEGRTFGMGRGILDATIDTPNGVIRFLGAHLKSKREIPEADQEMMRRAEAHLLRRQADRILSKEPDSRLIVYGDMNDIRQASAIRTIRGPRDGPKSLKMVRLRDSRDEYWTHHWSYQDVYSRFDYIFVSPPMTSLVNWDECRVLDDPEWADASDHRALLLVLK